MEGHDEQLARAADLTTLGVCICVDVCIHIVYVCVSHSVVSDSL